MTVVMSSSSLYFNTLGYITYCKFSFLCLTSELSLSVIINLNSHYEVDHDNKFT